MNYQIPVFGRGYVEMSENVARAWLFARNAHEGQLRKYTGEPYIVHPVEVMETVQSVEHTEDMLIAALLHDVVEDCGVLIEDIDYLFGSAIRAMVSDLTDISKPSDGNREKRKAIDRFHTSESSWEAKTIKLADLISNSKSILQHDKKFAVTYIKEKELLLEVLTEGDAALYAQAKQIVEDAKKELEIE